MPTYEYECKSCGYSFDVFQRMSDKPITDCPQCGKEVRRLINGGSGVIFKGSGFYVTDKNVTNKKGGEKAPSGSAKPGTSGESAGGGTAKPPDSGNTAKPPDSTGGTKAGSEGGLEKKAVG
jgi:putative FmdB family regulatory protein